MRHLTRIEVIEQNEWLDALEEAEDTARRKRDAASKAAASRPPGTQKRGR